MADATPPATGARADDSVVRARADDSVVTGEAVALEVAPTGLVLRAAGSAIDAIVSLLALLAGLLALAGLAGSGTLEDASVAALSIGVLVSALVVLPVVIETASRGRSVGRVVVGTRIVRLDGGPIGFRHALVRALTGVLEIYLTVGGGALVTGLVTTRSQRLGDLLAGTYAQHERAAKLPHAPLDVPPSLASWAATADVAAMPAPLARRIAAFLGSRDRLAPAARRALAGDLAAEARAAVWPLPDADPETFLVGVSALRRDRERRALAAERSRLDALSDVLRPERAGH